MKQLKLSCLLALLLSVLSIDVSALGVFEINGICYVFNGDEAIVVVDKQGYYSGSVVIPKTVTYQDKTYTVTYIGDCAFMNCTGLTSVVIPNSVTGIGIEAFYGCSGLTSVNIPNSVTSIGQGTFLDCTSLTSVNIPNSVTGIGDFAFDNCI